ncbi:bifunctional sugar phosphate isomerase/epimerase/4-hydroxyphenylpyruvate dioxygenase family protein [Pararobbsia silviterrae]|uniref:3-dehydroshikimate dehydratase n=1 Tax=Pararobbsia silviterrae TaxID=1792498 RepID=A0A494XZV9_9BURK|nr:sugar phosphate isomerase/epimerase and 4-hydroxyphenylpyruvate domain-containing protein [Pararobbsia silviterrae]RKP56045.1 sugar phosphate isomerase/epimerase and 4-hydroxyphenylpyruvate domain-containing protein [Pararobbsia silviterrae]
MKRSIATVSLSGTLEEKLRACANAGYDGIELFENDLLCSVHAPETVRRMCEDLGIEIALYQPFRDFDSTDPARFARNLERARRKFDLMHRLGADKILVCSHVGADAVFDRQQLVDQLGQLARLAQSAHVEAGYEALAWGRHVHSYRDAWRAVREVDHPNLGIVLDSFHTLSIRDDLSELDSIPGDRITFVQLADAPLLAMDVLEWSRHFRCFPGQGSFELAPFVAPILRNGYAGPLSLEVFNDGFRSAPARVTALDGLRSLIWVEDRARAYLDAHDVFATPAAAVFAVHDGESGSTHDEPQGIGHATAAVESVRAQTAAPASLVSPTGFAFLEFAVDDATRTRLADWLAHFGFVRARRHRSKRVSLYQQGPVNLILNAEPDSFADRFYGEHGLSLCAAALAVDDADTTLNRATTFRYAPYKGSVGPEEREIPGVVAPDGSLIYLVADGPGKPTIYDTDFVPTHETAPADAADLTGIDHLCLALPRDAIDSWVLFAQAAFGLKPEQQWMLPDPYGLVRSRALRSDDGRLRISLNTSDDTRTSVARALTTYGGAGLHHVAFGTSNAIRTAAHLAARGVPMLAIPDNYYEDVAARFGLDDAFVAQLRESNVLYDRDEQGGELLHAYTQQIGTRFFFEIVERRGGYDGYGVANTPVRNAAHAWVRALAQQ